MNELDNILDGLVQRTTDGKLQWKRTVAENEFVTSVDAIGIVVRELGQNSLGFPLRRQLEIADENGATVEVIETGGGMVGVQHDQRQSDERARQLKQLYEMARRSALDTQATLEKLAKALGTE